MSWPRSYEVLVKTDTSAFAELYASATAYAGRFDRWVEIRSEGMAFRFVNFNHAFVFMTHCLEKQFEIICRWPENTDPVSTPF
jgi:hypothetical protein